MNPISNTTLQHAMDRLELQILVREEIVRYAIACTYGFDEDVDPRDEIKIKEG